MENIFATPEQIEEIAKALGETADVVETALQHQNLEFFSQKIGRGVKSMDSFLRSYKTMQQYNPSLANDYMMDVNINPQPATRKQVESWLKQPHLYADKLSNLSQYLSYVVGQYKTLITSASASKNFNYVLLPDNAIANFNEVDKKAYLADYEKAMAVCKKLNMKYQLSKADLGVLYDGAYFFYIKEYSDSYSFIQLPKEYCTITAPFGYGFRFSLDVTFLDNFHENMKQVVPELYDVYGKYNLLKKEFGDIPEINQFRYVPMSPNNSWVFTADILHPDVVPPFASSMTAALDILSYRDIVQSKVATDLFRILALNIPLDPQTKKMTIPYEQATEIVRYIRSELPPNIFALVSPFEAELQKESSFAGLNDLSTLGDATFAASSGLQSAELGSTPLVNGEALNSVAKRKAVQQSQNDYLQYENFVNYLIAQKTTKYKFKVKFVGNGYSVQEDINLYTNMVSKTGTGKDFLLATMGVEPHQYNERAFLLDAMNLEKVEDNQKKTIVEKRPKDEPKDEGGVMNDSN